MNVYSAEFQRPMSNPNITGLTSEQTQKQININSKEFMPSKQNEAFASKKVINQHQIQELLEHKKKISEKIKNSLEAGSKIRLDDILEDETINVDNEHVED